MRDWARHAVLGRGESPVVVRWRCCRRRPGRLGRVRAQAWVSGGGSASFPQADSSAALGSVFLHLGNGHDDDACLAGLRGGFHTPSSTVPYTQQGPGTRYYICACEYKIKAFYYYIYYKYYISSHAFVLHKKHIYVTYHTCDLHHIYIFMCMCAYIQVHAHITYT